MYFRTATRSAAVHSSERSRPTIGAGSRNLGDLNGAASVGKDNLSYDG